MSNLTRKDFLRLSSWAVVASLLPIGNLKAFTSITSKDGLSVEDFTEAKELAKQARLFFYQKNFVKAEELYLQSIVLAPRYIQFYDGLDNVYGAKSDFLSSVELYKKGLLINPNVLSFYDRASRSLMRLELGNSKKANQYKGKINSISLLNDAQLLLEHAIALGTSKKYLLVSLDKVKKKIQLSSINDPEQIKLLCKEDKKSNREKYKDTFNLKSDIEITQLLNKVETKKRVQLYHIKDIEHQKVQIAKQKKRYSRILFSKTTLDSPNRTELAQKIFDFDHSDSNSMRLLKKEYERNNRYFDVIAVRQNFADKTQKFSSYLGLMDAYHRAFLKNQIALVDLQKAIAVGTDLYDNWSLLEKDKVDVSNKMSILYLLSGQYDQAKLILESVINEVSTNNPAVVNKLIFSYSKVFFEQSNYEQAKLVLLAGINESELADDTFINIKTIAKNKKTESINDKLILYYLLYSVYKTLNQHDQANAILEKITNNNPNDQFVLTRS